MARIHCVTCGAEFCTTNKTRRCRTCRKTLGRLSRSEYGVRLDPPGHEARIRALEARIQPELRRMGLLPEEEERSASA